VWVQASCRKAIQSCVSKRAHRLGCHAVGMGRTVAHRQLVNHCTRSHSVSCSCIGPRSGGSARLFQLSSALVGAADRTLSMQASREHQVIILLSKADKWYQPGTLELHIRTNSVPYHSAGTLLLCDEAQTRIVDSSGMRWLPAHPPQGRGCALPAGGARPAATPPTAPTL
jgi:hypothetical protein